MDLNNLNVGRYKYQDASLQKTLDLFKLFLKEYEEKFAQDVSSHSKQLSIDFNELQNFDQNLSNIIENSFYCLYPYLCETVSKQFENYSNVAFFGIPLHNSFKNLKSIKIGRLLRITGQVLRTYPVYPELLYGSFTCLECQSKISNIYQQYKFTQPIICVNPACGNRKKFKLDLKFSLFKDFQRVYVQEVLSDNSNANIPKSIEIMLRDNLVESINPGDKCEFFGSLIVLPDVHKLFSSSVHIESKLSLKEENSGVSNGFIGTNDISYKLAFVATSMKKITDHASMITDLDLDDNDWAQIYSMSKDKRLYQHLVDSVFPAIYGYEDIKKGILLMLFGGVNKETAEKTHLRGDINICLIGDPSSAKSQILRTLQELHPRAIYTNGKSSSAAGLTAAVIKDEDTGQFVIEAGALMLADNGICCIDEFDNMDHKDQIAIHEAMEQQTISIAKAGVKACLSARTAILAAANPLGGRYDNSKSLRNNISLSGPILSRFDLLFVILDESNEQVDRAVGNKIMSIHADEKKRQIYSYDIIQKYIRFAKKFKPILSKSAASEIINCYKKLRHYDNTYSNLAWKICARQIEALIRLSEAMAKMHCLDQVEAVHVQEAFSLLNKSILRLEVMDIKDDDILQDSEIDSQSDLVEPTNTTKNSFNISYKDYKKISQGIISYLKMQETEEDSLRITKTQIKKWYLEQISSEIENEDELLKEAFLIDQIIERLINVDHILIKLEMEGDMEDDYQVILHPNYVIN